MTTEYKSQAVRVAEIAMKIVAALDREKIELLDQMDALAIARGLAEQSWNRERIKEVHARGDKT
jgi:hypothetical protein